MSLQEVWDSVRHREFKRKMYTRIRGEQVLEGGGQNVKFIPDEGYFQLVLSEMFIRDRREYWKSFLPFVVMLADFIFDGATRTVPVFIGNELLKSIEAYIQGDVVEYRNTTMLGPTPYSGGKLEVFVGLFRTKCEDLAGDLLGVVNEISRIFPLSELSRYIEIAAPLGRGITRVLGIPDVELRVGVRDVFDESGPNELRTGYSAIVNCNEGIFNSNQFWVQDGRLLIGNNRPEIQFDSHDYCLVRYDFRAEREFSTLAFSKLWQRMKAMVWEGQQAKAQAVFLELGQQLSVSPDLTRSHRFDLIRLYKANLEREIDAFNQARGPSSSPDEPSRGGGSPRGGKAAIQGVLARLEQLNSSAALKDSLTEVSGRWEEIMEPFTKNAESQLTDEILQQQLQALNSAKVGPADPQELLDGLTATAMRTN